MKVARKSELFANEIGQAFTGDGSHARGHFLDYDQRDGGGDQGPQQRVAVLGAGLRIGKDAAGIVIDVGGDEARAQNRQEGHQPEFNQREIGLAAYQGFRDVNFAAHERTY